MTEMATVRARVTGRVQGVAYRAWTRDEALRRGLSGWVANEPDGAVTAILFGRSEAVAAMVEAMRIGPPAAAVAGIAVEPTGERPPTGFTIRR